MRQHKAERNQNDDLPVHRQQQRLLGLPKPDVDVLQRHLHEKHDGTHQEHRRIALDDLRDGLACGKQPCVYYRERHRDGPDADHVDKRDDRHIFDPLFQACGVCLSVIIAHERLHTVSKTVQGQGNKLQRAQHDGQRGGIVLVAAGRAVQIDVEDDLDGAFRQRHDERRKAQRKNAENAPRRQAQQACLKAEQAFPGEEKADDPNARAKLREDRREA